MDLLSIPDDLLVLILSFFNANEIESYVKTTCKTLCVRVTQSMSLWRLLCLRTGKLPSNNGSKAVSCQYRDLYFETICVPVDRPSIQEALDDILQKPRPVTIITLMPGVHRERVEFDICSQHLPIVCDEAVRFCIRAAFPERGASLVYCGQKSSDDEHPCVQLTTIGNDLRNRGYIHLELEHLTLLHYTKGNNIWRGNTCVRVDGSNTLLSMKSCTVQSDSGRGIVVTRSASLHLRDSTVHDCAATGLYIGDRGSFGLIQSSNILRNGFGTRLSNFVEQGDDTSLDLSRSHLVDEEMHDNENIVPPGHSGIYVESTKAIIENTMMAGNSLSALSVVRGGSSKLRDCDLIENGAHPLMVEEVNDVFLQMQPEFQNFIRGGIDDLGGNCMGLPVPNPRDLEIGKKRFRAPVPEKICAGHLTMIDLYK